MFLYSLVTVIVTIACLIALAIIAFWIFAAIQGDERIEMVSKRRTAFRVEARNFQEITLSCDLPFINKGKQNGTIMDLYPRHLLPQEQFDSVKVSSWTMDVKRPRHDGYWEAVIIEPKKGGTVRVFVTLMAKDSGSILDDAAYFPDMNIDIVYQVVGRSDWHIAKHRICLTAQEVRQALAQ